MPEDDHQVAIETFHEEWSEQTQFLSAAPRYRVELESLLTRILRRIDQKWYDVEDVVEVAEEVTSELSDSISPQLEETSHHSLDKLEENLSDAIEADRRVLSGEFDLQETVSRNIDADAIEDAIEERDYQAQHIKSALFAEVANIANREEKKSLNLYSLAEQFRDCREELASSEFQRTYRENLVEPIEQYLNQESPDVPLEEVIPELLGELQSAGWEEDSLEEAVETLETSEDIEEFCDVLRGERYEREYCVPLPADRIPEPHLNVAGVDFYIGDCEQFTFLEELIEVDERVEQAIEMATQDTDFFAVLTVTAPTQEVGEKRLKQKLERGIDALNYSKDKGIVQSPFTQHRTKYFYKLQNGRYGHHVSNHQKYAFPHSFRVNEEGVEILEEKFEFFDKPEHERTELEERFIKSYRWYGDGLQSGVPEEELLKYIISMESMLVPEVSRNKKNLLAVRLADLRGVYDEYRDSFKDEVIRLYKTRNNLVHNAEIDVYELENEVSSARTMATRMFDFISQEYIDECEDTGELIDELEETEIPEAPDDHNPFVRY